MPGYLGEPGYLSDHRPSAIDGYRIIQGQNFKGKSRSKKTMRAAKFAGLTSNNASLKVCDKQTEKTTSGLKERLV
jgi:hypothetical protein